MEPSMTTKKPLPANLHVAYNWINYAGELGELKAFVQSKELVTFAMETLANYYEYAEPESVDLDVCDILDLHDWLIANP